jgi:hypothetical protein
MLDIAAGLLHHHNGEWVPPLPTVDGVYAPDSPVRLIQDRQGRQGLDFPVHEEWIGDEPLLAVPLNKWPGWHVVNLDVVGALEKFVQIDSGQDAAGFAQKHGPLWACVRHPFPCLWRAGQPGHRWVNAEPLDWWLRMARQLRGVLVAGERLRDGQRLRAEDWHALGRPASRSTVARLSKWTERFFVASAISSHLEASGATFIVRPGSERGFALELNTGLGFVPALWQETAGLLAGGRAIAVCSNCSRPYVRHQRAAKAGQRNYCGSCGRSARQKLWRQANIAESRGPHPLDGSNA